MADFLGAHIVTCEACRQENYCAFAEALADDELHRNNTDAVGAMRIRLAAMWEKMHDD